MALRHGGLDGLRGKEHANQAAATTACSITPTRERAVRLEKASDESQRHRDGGAAMRER